MTSESRAEDLHSLDQSLSESLQVREYSGDVGYHQLVWLFGLNMKRETKRTKGKLNFLFGTKSYPKVSKVNTDDDVPLNLSLELLQGFCTEHLAPS